MPRRGMAAWTRWRDEKQEGSDARHVFTIVYVHGNRRRSRRQGMRANFKMDQCCEETIQSYIKCNDI